jgi:hypothetical protein
MATTTFDNLITFSRGSNATVTGPNGLIQRAPTNLLLNSESFEVVGWDKANATIYPNQDFSGLAVGPELVTLLDGWTPSNATISVVGGQLVITSSGSGTAYITKNFANVGGAYYYSTSTVSGGSAIINTYRSGPFTNFMFSLPTDGTNSIQASTDTDATAAVTLFWTASAAGETRTLSNISIKEITPAAATAPDGTRTADTLISSGIAGIQRIGLSGAPASTTTGLTTYSVYVKAGTAQFIQILHGSDANAFANFNVASGTLGTRGTGASSTITDAGNGWYRCTFTFNIASGAVWYIYIVSSASAAYGASFTATVAGLLLWGAQLELGSIATTYNNTSVRNLLGFSEAFDNAAWTKTRASIVTGAQANPVNGLFNAQKLMVDTATGSHRVISGAGATASGTRHTFSVYIKQGEYAKAAIGEFNNGVGWASFDLQAGTVLATGGTGSPSASITTAGNGWFRCAVTCTVGAFSRLDIYALNAAYTTADPSVYSYTGDGNSGVYIYGAQLSNSASLDPYVPTPGAAPSSTAYYGPRFDYDPVTLLPRGLLIEEQRTNLLPFSDQFDNAAWSKQNTTITANTAVAPDGTMTADTLTAATTGLFRYVQQQPTLTNGVTYTLTAYLKYKTARWVWLLGETTTDAFAVFDVLNGAVGDASSGITRSITPVGNGWYRCTATFLVGSATATQQVGIGLSDTNTVSNPPATAGIDAYIWGIQLEAGAFATSYIPTIASTVTRSADIAVITGSLFSQWYNGVEGSFVASFTAAQNTFTTYIAASNGVVAQNSMHMDNDGSGNMRVAYYSGSSAVALLSLGTIGAVGTVNTLSTAYQANNFAASRNGGTVVSDTAGAVPVGVNRLNIGADPSGAAVNVSNGHIRSIRYVPVRAADFQLQELTAQSIVDYAFLQTASGDQLVDGNGDYLYSIPIFG